MNVRSIRRTEMSGTGSPITGGFVSPNRHRVTPRPEPKEPENELSERAEPHHEMAGTATSSQYSYAKPSR
jgi:hypothetical protein